jgi:pimeloyl-ACP methyl ester carboxylesterase
MSGPSATSPEPPASLSREAGAEECRATVDGVGIRYLRAGSGPPLLLIHGLLGYSFSWRKNIAALARVATLYAPDLPGAGYSDRAPTDCSFAGFARLMLRFMDTLGIEHATVAGTSHGGAVAMTMAAQDLESGRGRVERLVLVDPVNPYSRAGRKRIAFFSSAIGGFLLLRATPVLTRTHGYFLRRMYGDPRRISPGTVEGYGAAIAVPGTMPLLLARVRCWSRDLVALRDALPRIADLPTLLIWGTRDTAVPPSSAEPLQRHFRHSRLVMLEGAGHLPYEEVPDEFNRVLIEFLTNEFTKP